MNTERNTTQLLALRPQLAIEAGEVGSMEYFQSNTLRPILKMQHSLLLRIFENYLKEVKIDFFHLSAEKQRTFIEQSLAKQVNLKYLLIGTLVGYFTAEELAFYELHQAELHKRLTKFLAKRIFDGMTTA